MRKSEIIKGRRHPRLPSLLVTADGRVFRELLPSRDSFGYHQIRNGDLRERRHKLVCETYHGICDHMHVRHMDGDAGNDHADNLAWGTIRENMADKIRHGTSLRGENNTGVRITEATARQIKFRLAAGERGRTLSREFGVSEGTISDIRHGRTWAWLVSD